MINEIIVAVVPLALGILLASFPLWLLVRAVNRGTWNGRGVDVLRSKQPVAFWFGVGMYAVIAIIVLYLPVYLALVTLR